MVHKALKKSVLTERVEEKKINPDKTCTLYLCAVVAVSVKLSVFSKVC